MTSYLLKNDFSSFTCHLSHFVQIFRVFKIYCHFIKGLGLAFAKNCSQGEPLTDDLEICKENFRKRTHSHNVNKPQPCQLVLRSQITKVKKKK